MRILGLLITTGCAALSGCVLGSGPCLLQQPFKHTLAGTIRFQTFSAGDEIDTVPVLSVDRTAYIYAPANGRHCLPANDLQLVGWTELPPDIPENTHVQVKGSVFQAATPHQHTPFLINVRNIFRTEPASAPPGAVPPGPGAPPTPAPAPRSPHQP